MTTPAPSDTKSAQGNDAGIWKTIQPILEQITPRIIWSPAPVEHDMAKLSPYMLLMHLLKPISGQTGLPLDIDPACRYDPVVHDIMEKSGLDALQTQLTPAQQTYVVQVVNAALAVQNRRKAEHEAWQIQRQQQERDEYVRTHHACGYAMRSGARVGQPCGRMVTTTMDTNVRCGSHKGK
jgi:hypothetical protein